MWVNSSKDFTNGPLISWPNMRLAPKNQTDASQKSHTLLILKHTETKKLKEIFLKCHTRLHVREREKTEQKFTTQRGTAGGAGYWDEYGNGWTGITTPFGRVDRR